MIYVKKSILFTLFLALEAVFIAMQQPFDVFTVPHPCHEPEYDADSKQMPLSRIENQNTYRKSQTHIELSLIHISTGIGPAFHTLFPAHSLEEPETGALNHEAFAYSLPYPASSPDNSEA